MKIAIFYSYNGAKFCGSQTQPNAKAVEDSLNLALRKVGIFENAISSSRTDALVHALCQVSCTHCGDFWDLNKLKNELNRHLPFSIRVFKILKVLENFHPRYSAKARSYRYLLAHGKANPFLADFVYFCPKPDIKRLNFALSLFKGTHDFSGFYKLGSNEKSPLRTIFSARARQFYFKNDCFSMIIFKANGFLRSQVRLMVANALLAAASEQKLHDLEKILKFSKAEFFENEFYKSEFSKTEFFEKFNENKSEFYKSEFFKKIPTKIPAPAQGLYLKKIFY